MILKRVDDFLLILPKDTLINRNLATFLDRVHHLHTFSQTGTYIIRSSHFQTTATVLVDTETNIRQQSKSTCPESNDLQMDIDLQGKRVLPPELRTLLDPVSEFSKTVQLTCPNRDATIYYTLDGLLPTRFMGDVRVRECQIIQEEIHVDALRLFLDI